MSSFSASISRIKVDVKIDILLFREFILRISGFIFIRIFAALYQIAIFLKNNFRKRWTRELKSEKLILEIKMIKIKDTENKTKV